MDKSMFVQLGESVNLEIPISKVTEVNVEKEVFEIGKMKDGKYRLTYYTGFIKDINKFWK